MLPSFVILSAAKDLILPSLVILSGVEEPAPSEAEGAWAPYSLNIVRAAAKLRRSGIIQPGA